MPALDTPRHEAYCQAFVTTAHRVQWRAYQAAYPESNRNTARTNSSRLMKDPAVRERIAELERAELDRLGITDEMIIGSLVAISRANVDDVMTWDGAKLTVKPSNQWPPHAKYAVAEIHQSADGAVRIKFHSKQRATETLARIRKLYDDTPPPLDGETLRITELRVTRGERLAVPGDGNGNKGNGNGA